MPSKNPKNAIRKAYYDILNNIIVDGFEVPCFDTFVPSTAVKPYIVIGNIFYNDGPKVKDAYLYELGVVIDVYRDDNNEVGYKQTDEIMNSITKLILSVNGVSQLNLSPHFAVITTKIDSADQDPSNQENKLQYTNTLIFNHVVEQLIENQ